MSKALAKNPKAKKHPWTN